MTINFLRNGSGIGGGIGVGGGIGLHRRTWAAIVCAMLSSLALSCAAAPAKPLPANSIYQLPLPLVDQNERAFALDSFRGKPLLISMFYSSCQFVCPRIVESLRRTEAGLPADLRGSVPLLMVTIDTVHDTAAVLKAMAQERQLDENVWTLARSDARNARKLAALLGIQYRELPSGEFNHTSLILLLDADGRIVGKTAVLGAADPTFVNLVRKQAAVGSAVKRN